MQGRNPLVSRSVATVVVGLITLNTPGFANPGKPSGAPPNVPAVVPQVEIPKSVFVVPTQPKDGRNPFFPQSSTGFQAPKPVVSNTEIDASLFVLNGITSPPKRTAMINGRTFEPGEEGDVRLPTGAKVRVKCQDIRRDSAIIQVNGQRRELRLRPGI